MKPCIKCKQIKPLGEYYAHPQMADGHINKCKPCAREANKTSNGDQKRFCLECGKKFMTRISEIRRGAGLTCSRTCYYQRSKKIQEKKYSVKSTYDTIHRWIYKHKGKATMCEQCGVKDAKQYHWSNKSGKYKQDLSDWWQLCIKCHHAYDNIAVKAWETRRQKYGQNGHSK